MKRSGLALHWQVIIGLVLGLIYAFFAVRNGWTDFTLDYINPFGDIFINLLKLIAVPLVLFSIISGVTSLKDIRKLGQLGAKTLGLYLLTTMFAVLIGLLLVNLYRPGARVNDDIRTENRIGYEIWKKSEHIQDLDDICLSCLPKNRELVEAIKNRRGTEVNPWVKDKIDKAEATKNTSPLQPLVDIVPTNIFMALGNMNMLQIIFFAIFFGVVVAAMPKEKAKPIESLIDGLNEVFVRMVWIVMKAMPFFVFALMAGQVVKAAGTDPIKFRELLSFLLQYSMTLVVGLALMVFFFYPLFIRLIAKVSPGKFLNHMKDAQLTAFSTSSSVATLPVTMDCIENKMGVPKSISSFVLPIGATVNMDGTSLYQAVAVVSLAQFHMVDLSIMQQAIIVLTATLASIGAAAIPSAGLVLMIIVLESVGLNPAWIALIFPVDRILDMCRTVVNVTGDATVSTIVAVSEGELKRGD